MAEETAPPRLGLVAALACHRANQTPAGSPGHMKLL